VQQRERVARDIRGFKVGRIEDPRPDRFCRNEEYREPDQRDDGESRIEIAIERSVRLRRGDGGTDARRERAGDAAEKTLAQEAAFAQYFARGYRDWQPVEAETVATAIKIGNPASTPRAERTIKFTNGIVLSVSDDEILDAKAEIDRIGIGCEPASAATVAGIRKLARAGMLSPETTVAGILTGHVLKDAEAVTRYHLDDVAGAPRAGANRPVTIAASMRALEQVLADALHG